MSDENGPPVDDPLRALRAADHRPVSVVWRERVMTWLRRGDGHAGSVIARTGVVVAVGLVVLGFGWQSYVATEPPIEDSIPLAVSTTTSLVSPDDILETVSPADDAVFVVHVAGAVRSPGLVEGGADWRVNDAVDAAGGALGDADLDRVNLAAPIADGMHLYIPVVGQDPPVVLGAQSAPANASGGVIDINSASLSELETIPGVGPVTAGAIVDHRENHGPFANVDALVAVRGIGPATVDGMREHVRAS